jgi:hypothetical protein
MLDRLPGAYGKEIYVEKCRSIFEHGYERYHGEGVNVFAGS